VVVAVVVEVRLLTEVVLGQTLETEPLELITQAVAAVAAVEQQVKGLLQEATAALVLSSSKSQIRIAQSFHRGGSGIVIIKVPDTVTATFSGGVTSSLSTSVPGFNIYSVTATSTTGETVTFAPAFTADFLVIAGGGGGGAVLALAALVGI
jgi:hypothetical protein